MSGRGYCLENVNPVGFEDELGRPHNCGDVHATVEEAARCAGRVLGAALRYLVVPAVEVDGRPVTARNPGAARLPAKERAWLERAYRLTWAAPLPERSPTAPSWTPALRGGRRAA